MRSLVLGLRSRFERVLVKGLHPVAVALGAVAAIVVLGVLSSRLVADLERATQALTLLVPVVVAAALGGRRAAYVASATAAAVLALLTPPVGSFRVRLAEDIVVLLVFAGVALLIDTLVAGRIEVLGRVERHRAVLLRSVSHDLRTPLATIRAAASELVDGPHDEETRAKLAAPVRGRLAVAQSHPGGVDAGPDRQLRRTGGEGRCGEVGLARRRARPSRH